MTADQLLRDIKIIAGKRQMFGPKNVTVDTLMLILRISEDDIKILITELTERGEISYQPPASHSYRLGTVSIVDQP